MKKRTWLATLLALASGAQLLQSACSQMTAMGLSLLSSAMYAQMGMSNPYGYSTNSGLQYGTNMYGTNPYGTTSPNYLTQGTTGQPGYANYTQGTGQTAQNSPYGYSYYPNYPQGSTTGQTQTGPNSYSYNPQGY